MELWTLFIINILALIGVFLLLVHLYYKPPID